MTYKMSLYVKLWETCLTSRYSSACVGIASKLLLPPFLLQHSPNRSEERTTKARCGLSVQGKGSWEEGIWPNPSIIFSSLLRKRSRKQDISPTPTPAHTAKPTTDKARFKRKRMNVSVQTFLLLLLPFVSFFLERSNKLQQWYKNQSV